MVAGSLQIKNDVFYIVLIYKDNEGASKRKWLTTGLSSKGNNKRKAEKMLTSARERFNPCNPKVNLEQLLNENLENGGDKNNELVNTQSQLPLIPEQPKVADDILFADYMESWLEKIRRRVEESTYSSYRLNVNSKIVPHFRELGIMLNELTAKDIHAFYEKCSKGGLKAESVRRLHSNIRKALVDAADDDLLHTMVISKLKRPIKPKKETFQAGYYSLEELNDLLAATKGHILEIPIKLAAVYGLRREEVIGLKWSAINFQNETISIKNTILSCNVDGKYALVEKARAKNETSLRTLPMVGEFKELLLTHKEWIAQNRKEFKKGYNTKYLDYVCVNQMGDLIKPGYATKNFKKLLEANDLRLIRFHDLRHTCASLQVANGIPMKALQEWLGHSNYSTTADLYSHLDYQVKLNSANILAESGIKIMTPHGQGTEPEKPPRN